MSMGKKFYELSENALQEVRRCMIGVMVAESEGKKIDNMVSTFGGWILYQFWLNHIAPGLSRRDAEIFRLKMIELLAEHEQV